MLCLCGCTGPDWAKTLDVGTVQPNMRFDIAPTEELDPEALYPRFAKIADDEGFIEYRGQPVDKQFRRAIEGPAVWAFTWFDPESSEPIHSVSFMRNEGNADNVDAFTVVLSNDGMQDFDVDDWILYKDWEERVLPDAFPGAEIRQSRHPARFTAPEQIELIAEQSEMAIPDSIREKLREAENQRD